MYGSKNIPDDFTPVLRFAAASDSHIKEKGDSACKKLEKLFETCGAIAENDEKYPHIDALVMVGDTVNSGEKEQYDAFFRLMDAAKRQETRFLGVIAKYHDCDKTRSQVADFTRRTGQPADFHTVINGFHFIGISVCPDPEVFHYSEEQKAWLDREIAAAVSDTPHLPVFVFQHEHVRDTVYGSTLFDGWGELYFSDIFKKYPNIIDVSGHSHYPASDPRAIWQGDFTAVNDGGLSYFEFTFDGERKYHPENADVMAQFLIIEADKKGAVRIRTFDLNADAFTADRFIPNAADKSAFYYGHEQRTAKAASPYFESGAEISAAKTESGCTLTTAPAKTGEDDAVFLYRLSVLNENGDEVLSEKSLSDYYYRCEPENVSFDCALLSGKYTAFLTAESVWQKQSAPLTAHFEI